MDVIAHAGAVGRVVIRAEDGDPLKLAGGDLCDEGHEVAGRVVGVFADQRRAMRACRVEVAQHADGPVRVRAAQPVQHLLADDLGLSIRVHRVQGRGFRCRYLVGQAVDRGRGGKHQAATARRFHRAQKRGQPADIHVEVIQRPHHAFAHRLEGGEMHHGFDPLLDQNARQEGLVAHIALDQLHRPSGDLRQPVGHRAPRVCETVEDHHLVPGFDQGDMGVRADIACPPGQKNT